MSQQVLVPGPIEERPDRAIKLVFGAAFAVQMLWMAGLASSVLWLFNVA